MTSELPFHRLMLSLIHSYFNFEEVQFIYIFILLPVLLMLYQQYIAKSTVIKSFWFFQSFISHIYVCVHFEWFFFIQYDFKVQTQIFLVLLVQKTVLSLLDGLGNLCTSHKWVPTSRFSILFHQSAYVFMTLLCHYSFSNLLCMYTTWHSTCTEVKRQLWGIGSLLPW